MRLLKVLLALAILAIAGLSGFAYLGDMTPERREMRVPITLEAGGAVAGRATPADAAAMDGEAESAPAEDEAATAPADDAAAIEAALNEAGTEAEAGAEPAANALD